MKYESLIKPPISAMIKSGRVVLSSGESVGEHVTVQREELIIVLRGVATITESLASPRMAEEVAEIESIEFAKTERKIVSEGQVHFIGENILHNVQNESENELEYVYVVGLLENIKNKK